MVSRKQILSLLIFVSIAVLNTGCLEIGDNGDRNLMGDKFFATQDAIQEEYSRNPTVSLKADVQGTTFHYSIRVDIRKSDGTIADSGFTSVIIPVSNIVRLEVSSLTSNFGTDRLENCAQSGRNTRHYHHKLFWIKFGDDID